MSNDDIITALKAIKDHANRVSELALTKPEDAHELAKDVAIKLAALSCLIDPEQQIPKKRRNGLWKLLKM